MFFLPRHICLKEEWKRATPTLPTEQEPTSAIMPSFTFRVIFAFRVIFCSFLTPFFQCHQLIIFLQWWLEAGLTFTEGWPRSTMKERNECQGGRDVLERGSLGTVCAYSLGHARWLFGKALKKAYLMSADDADDGSLGQMSSSQVWNKSMQVCGPSVMKNLRYDSAKLQGNISTWQSANLFLPLWCVKLEIEAIAQWNRCDCLQIISCPIPG